MDIITRAGALRLPEHTRVRGFEGLRLIQGGKGQQVSGYEEVGWEDEEDGLDDVEGFEEVGAFMPSSLFRALSRKGLVRRSASTKARVRAPYGRLQQPRSLPRSIAATDERRRYLPIGNAATINGGAVGALTVTAEGPIQGERLILTHNLAVGDILVTDVLVGTKSQLESIGQMPIEAFGFDATGSILRLRPLKTGQSFTVNLLNTAVGAGIISGVLLGITSSEG